ncbi:hypothetical protein TREMEDRAFT_58469 [Tremella mesenterica DSM 1558]|uniref:uncharacterized protein n=1 Tax=Tremella mesenterica (strain ATCC 24925 / CBS 8224 / DSM 1558 / NBRC 9311 / NRRL Y-6157 / RJB 2259-6 / UBC 559-6) TaxID=578456 RepID=UPI0003F4A173|nr:uncharacterized protein TREMEDRAFT_58469 [Tremella mesenterica DSM 1558]EIW72307.1 hypothetical protein TREMEDRAFT_58469 [Tremella mesenterica DSM 1558]
MAQNSMDATIPDNVLLYEEADVRKALSSGTLKNGTQGMAAAGWKTRMSGLTRPRNYSGSQALNEEYRDLQTGHKIPGGQVQFVVVREDDTQTLHKSDSQAFTCLWSNLENLALPQYMSPHLSQWRKNIKNCAPSVHQMCAEDKTIGHDNMMGTLALLSAAGCNTIYWTESSNSFYSKKAKYHKLPQYSWDPRRESFTGTVLRPVLVRPEEQRRSGR